MFKGILSRTYTLIVALCGLFLVLISCLQPGIRNPYKALELKRYSLATQLFTKEYELVKDKKEKSTIAFHLGDCFDKMGEYDLSKQWYKKSYDLDKSNKTLLAYAYSLKKNEEYQDAMDAFAELSNEVQGSSLFRKEANICKLAKEIKKNPNKKYNYKIDRLEFSSEASDYSATYDYLGRIFFSSDRIGSSGKDKYEWSGAFYSDLYSVVEKNEASKLDPVINTKDNEGSCCFNSSLSYIYYTRCSDLSVGNYYCQIFRKNLSTFNSEDELLNLGGGLCNNMHPALHYSDSILVFSSDRADGKGNFDLYLSYWLGDKWSEGINLSDVLNSEGNEKFPVWHKDTLYFSSDYHPGFGSFDIFKTWQTKSGWVQPQRLDYPINSGADDFSYSIDPKFVPNDSIFEKAILTSNRDFRNSDDIYSVYKIKIKPAEAPKKAFVNYTLKLNYFATSEYKLQSTQNIPIDSVSIQLNSDLFSTQSTNTISINSNAGSRFNIRSGRSGYLNHDLDISLDSISNVLNDTTILREIDIFLIPLRYDKEYLLKNVYYDLDKSDIREDAKPALNELYQLLVTNPAIKVLISSHTDCRSNDSYNLNLSEARAKSAGEYLIQKGIVKGRIKYKGFGETDPVIKCPCQSCTEDQHQTNRRSGFSIIK